MDSSGKASHKKIKHKISRKLHVLHFEVLFVAFVTSQMAGFVFGNACFCSHTFIAGVFSPTMHNQVTTGGQEALQRVGSRSCDIFLKFLFLHGGAKEMHTVWFDACGLTDTRHSTKPLHTASSARRHSRQNPLQRRGIVNSTKSCTGVKVPNRKQELRGRLNI